MSQNIDILKEVPGGPRLINWLGGADFGDSEIVSLHLNRGGQSLLCLSIERNCESKTVTFELDHWIDLSITGFNNQNVIGGIKLSIAGERKIEKWERGVAINPGQTIIDILPCFGAYGSIRANLIRVMLSD